MLNLGDLVYLPVRDGIFQLGIIIGYLKRETYVYSKNFNLKEFIDLNVAEMSVIYQKIPCYRQSVLNNEQMNITDAYFKQMLDVSMRQNIDVKELGQNLVRNLIETGVNKKEYSMYLLKNKLSSDYLNKHLCALITKEELLESLKSSFNEKALVNLNEFQAGHIYVYTNGDNYSVRICIFVSEDNETGYFVETESLTESQINMELNRFQFFKEQSDCVKKLYKRANSFVKGKVKNRKHYVDTYMKVVQQEKPDFVNSLKEFKSDKWKEHCFIDV